jgi:hypothetical protein
MSYGYNHDKLRVLQLDSFFSNLNGYHPNDEDESSDLTKTCDYSYDINGFAF